MTRYYGKYRGKVTNNLDPDNLGRIQVSVPAVFGDFTLNWALPSVPYAGMQNCFYAIPPVAGERLGRVRGGRPRASHLERLLLEHGRSPFARDGTPSTIPHLVFQTTAQTTLMLNDDPASGHPSQDRHGREDRDKRHGHNHRQRRGASIS
jgi:hypothetical protein